MAIKTLRQLVNEITQSTSEHQRSVNKYVQEIEKVLKKEMGDYCSVNVDDSQVIILDDGESGNAFDVHIRVLSRNLFSLECFIGGKHGKKYTETNLTMDDLLDWIKNELKQEVEELDKSTEDDLDEKGYDGSEKGKKKEDKSFTISSKDLNRKAGGPQK